MTRIEMYGCDICRRKFEKPSAVHNEVHIVNGEYDNYFAQVCGSCIRKIGESVEELRPEADRKKVEN